MPIDFAKRWLSRILVALTLSAVYLYAYPSATIFYFIVDLLHVAIGMVLAILLFFCLARLLPRETLLGRLGWFSLAAGALLGMALIKTSTPPRLKPWLYAHISLCVLGALFLAISWLISIASLGASVPRRSSVVAPLTL